MHSNLKK